MEPDKFSKRVREITETMQGHAAHRAMDAACEEVMRSLGYTEGVEIFESAVRAWHNDAAPYPRPPRVNWRCLFGYHRWIPNPPSEWSWLTGATCAQCGKLDSPGNPCP